MVSKINHLIIPTEFGVGLKILIQIHYKVLADYYSKGGRDLYLLYNLLKKILSKNEIKMNIGKNV